MLAPHAPQSSEQNQVLVPGQLPIERSELSSGPDVCPYLRGLSDDVVPGHNCLARAGPQQGRQDLDRGRLAGAVMAEQGADRSGGDRVSDALQRMDRPVESLRNAIELDHGY